MSKLTRKGFASGHFVFRLDHSKPNGSNYWETSWLYSVEGGEIKSAVINDTVGAMEGGFKYHGGVEIEPITVEAGMATAGPILDWIQESWTRQQSFRTGAITFGDFHYQGVMEQKISDALVEEVTFPTLDGSDKSPAFLKVKIRPERIETVKDRYGLDADRAFGSNRQKMWTPASFRLSIDGLDCSHVNRIESFTIKQKIKKLYLGSQRYPESVPVAVEFPQLTVTMTAAYAQDFVDWYESAVAGERIDLSQARKQGIIEFLDPDVRTPELALFTVKLQEVGISSLCFDKHEANADAIKRCKVELFVDSMRLERGAI